nr:MAG TPA: hypothetical protein [Caudoviricetes sp.]
MKGLGRNRSEHQHSPKSEYCVKVPAMWHLTGRPYFVRLRPSAAVLTLKA